MTADDRNLLLAVQGELARGEYLVWTGRPYAGIILRISKILPVLIFLSVVGAIIWFGNDDMAPDTRHGLMAGLLVLFGVPMLLHGLSSVFLEPRRRRRTLYALTNMRAIQARLDSGPVIESFQLSDMRSVSFIEHNQIGTVHCVSPLRTWAAHNRIEKPQPIFQRIVNPGGVYRLMVRLRPDLAGQENSPCPLPRRGAERR